MDSRTSLLFPGRSKVPLVPMTEVFGGSITSSVSSAMWVLVLGPPLEIGVVELFQHSFLAQQQALECLCLRWEQVTCLTSSSFVTLSLGSQPSSLPKPRGMGKPVQTDRWPDWIVTTKTPIWGFVFSFSYQSNALPSHVKISVSRQTLFEDSFQQVRE